MNVRKGSRPVKPVTLLRGADWSPNYVSNARVRGEKVSKISKSLWIRRNNLVMPCITLTSNLLPRTKHNHMVHRLYDQLVTLFIREK
jgi:hypothetical protein